MMNTSFSGLVIAAVIAGLVNAQSAAEDVDWPVYLGGPDSAQYSTLTDITRDNAADLQIAWTYDSEPGDEPPRGQIQCNPIVVEGVLYASSPTLKAFALDAATGQERWRFDPGPGSTAGVNRGLTYWADGDDKRIFFCAGNSLHAIDADAGTLVPTFGSEGRVDLREGLGGDASKLYVISNTPGIIYKNLLIVGTRVNEALPAAPGHIRAYNVRTGAVEWMFRTIPQPGEFGYETWPPDAHTYTGAANAWAGMSVDHERGLVFVPTGSAADDFYGANRHGENLFANSLLALRADTGERVWHFQTVHHDLWDRDLPAPPNLVTVTHNGKRIDAVAQITKSAFVFLFDRETGEPLFPIEERPVPSSDLIGESAWPTQPFPTKPPPFARQTFTEPDLTIVNATAHEEARELLLRSRTGEPFIPPSVEGTVIFPGFDGGGEWGGAAVDPNAGIMYVNANEMPWILQMVEVGTLESGRRLGKTVYARSCLYCHGVERRGDPLGVYPPLHDFARRLSREEATRIVRDGQGQMPAFKHLSDQQLEAVIDYIFEPLENDAPEAAKSGGDVNYSSTGYNRFVDADGNPAIKPPWGTLNAIDLNKGEILWQVPLGDLPRFRRPGEPATGTENYGGPVVTAGGVIFIAASKDEKFRVFDRDTGDVLWETKLPAAGYATPSTYRVNGKQYVVIAAGGGKVGTPSGDQYLAFALPD